VVDEKVASATPYTNSGTICSFPRFGLDNDVFNSLPVDTIDQAFRKIKPVYTPMPTGVGFCMALSRKAMDAIGFLDDITFEKGYGEENDWCQRAIKAGFTNVMVENLYVFHNHGGSFSSAEKQRLGKINSLKLREKHPAYEADVAAYCSTDALFDLRGYLSIEVARNLARDPWLVFNHRLGGGADVFVRQQIRERLKNGQGIYEVGYDYTEGAYLLTAYFGSLKPVLRFETWQELEDYLVHLDLSEICVSELVTYPRLYDTLERIRQIAKSHQARLSMMMHDYFAICPVINLLSIEGRYCHTPEGAVCDNCLRNNPRKNYADYGSMAEWRRNWGAFLAACDEIRCFSNSTKDILTGVYGTDLKIRVEGHQVDYMPAFVKTHKTTHEYRIGVVGTMAYHKGQAVVQKVINYIDENHIDMKIVHIGASEEPIEGKCFIQHGKYSPQELPRLLMQYDVDLIWIPSIVPETFSFSTSEAISLKMPLAVFDYGAPPERVRAYEKGMVLPSEEAEDIVKAFLSRKDEILSSQIPWNGKKPVLMLAEEPSYATRYRLEHLLEQQLLQGYGAELKLLDQLKNLKPEDYRSVVLYRCRMIPQLKAFLESCREKGLKIWFDVDDFVFDYEAIKDFPLVGKALDMDYETYCSRIRETMDMSDGFYVSTCKLQELVQRYFPEKPVLLHRNVASMQMVALSDIAYQNKPVSDGKVHIGYFSGSRTHNYDFELIKDVLAQILTEFPKAELTLGGVLEIPEEFSSNVNRVHTFKFTEWYNLPARLAEMDINLMPLEDTIFHECKSENKWTEAALVRVPTIASRNKELSGVIHSGEDGYLCSSREEWLEALRQLLRDDEFRQNMGRKAYERVLRDHTTKSCPTEEIQ
ncbi:MAG: glycosyltransferase, partial [Firmicutes bacterium]|nr:glycosyltransferase [Bacillota bacterium]